MKLKNCLKNQEFLAIVKIVLMPINIMGINILLKLQAPIHVFVIVEEFLILRNKLFAKIINNLMLK
jgi:hypothetical protein